jgi:hypothetical protein
MNKGIGLPQNRHRRELNQKPIRLGKSFFPFDLSQDFDWSTPGCHLLLHSHLPTFFSPQTKKVHNWMMENLPLNPKCDWSVKLRQCEEWSTQEV